MKFLPSVGTTVYYKNKPYVVDSGQDFAVLIKPKYNFWGKWIWVTKDKIEEKPRRQKD